MLDTPGASQGDEAATPGTPRGGAPQGDCRDGLTIVALAAARGISKDAARRLLRAGKLSAHRTLGPYGPAWCIHPDDPWRQGSEVATGAPGVRLGVATESGARGAPAVPAQPASAPAEAIAAMIQATLTPIVAPLVAELAASRQANERQADAIREQAETIGRQSAELEAARAQISTLEACTAPQSVEPTRGRSNRTFQNPALARPGG
jgi:hypothetical protein